MLTRLHVRNYVLIDSLEIDFPEGLVIITGQTGAGKSILLGALSLLMGTKADASMVSDGAENCVVEAEFEVGSQTVRQLLEENDIEWDGGHLIVRRTVNRSGRSRAFVNDSYNTGDMAWRDADGYFWFVGRNDDVIKCSGYRIGPFEVESALMTHPSVLECAVTAAPDPVRGQVVKATIVLAKGYTASDELKKEIQNHVKKVTAPYKYPRIVEFVDELPKTVSGKIKRADIRKSDS